MKRKKCGQFSGCFQSLREISFIFGTAIVKIKFFIGEI